MSGTHLFFRRPRLRPGVEISRTTRGVALEYRRQSVDLAVPPCAPADEVARLLELLACGATRDELGSQVRGLADLDGLLDELDRLGLLTEGDPPEPAAGMDGAELYRRVRRFATAFRPQVCGSQLYRALVDGRATRAQLLGYAIEYHHVVRRSPALIAPALAHAWPPVAFDVLQQFLAEEIGHHRMTEAALAVVGVQHPDGLLPLPATFAVCATLGSTAAADPLSFAACLFLVEEPSPEFNRAFADRARALGLPAEFSRPLLEHSGINDDAGHADVSLDLLRTVGWVGEEHLQAVLKQVAAMIESLARMERDILGHYPGDEPALRVPPRRAAS